MATGLIGSTPGQMTGKLLSTRRPPLPSSLLVKFVAAALLVSSLMWAAEKPGAMAKKARKAEAKGDYANAYLLYSQAVALDPDNPKYWSASQGVLARALPSLKVEAPELAGSDTGSEPDLPAIDPVTDEERIEALRLRPPPEIKPSSALVDHHLKGDAKALWEKVSAAYGLRVVFDGDYQAGNPIAFKYEKAPAGEALRALETQTGSFLVPISETLIMVAKDTTQKRTELEPNVAVLIPLPETFTPQELTEWANAIRSLFDLTRLGIDTQRRQLYIRDRLSRIRVAQRAIEQLTTSRGQIVVEAELLSVNKQTTTDYGVTLPSVFSLNWLGKTGFFLPTPIPEGIAGLLTFGGGKTQFGIGIGNASIFASMLESEARSITRNELRMLDGQPAQMHVGQRYPIITMGYYGDTGDASGTVYRPPPNIQFEDLGVVVKITPRVHNSEEVSLDVEAEYKALAGQTLNQIPVISNRKFKSILRLKYGQVAVMAGLVVDNQSRGVSGIPLLSTFTPLRNNSRFRDSTEIILTLRPHLITLPPTETMTTPIWSGTETRPRSLAE